MAICKEGTYVYEKEKRMYILQKCYWQYVHIMVWYIHVKELRKHSTVNQCNFEVFGNVFLHTW